jgi:CheY-like chemotaxis protein
MAEHGRHLGVSANRAVSPEPLLRVARVLGIFMSQTEDFPAKVPVLVADDEPLIRSLVDEALSDGGFAVIAATGGDEAIRQFDANASEIQAIVVDVRLGDGTDGWEVARHAREGNANVAVVYMSGDSAGQWASQGVPHSLMLQKPFTSAQVVTAVASLLNQVAPSGPSPS